MRSYDEGTLNIAREGNSSVTQPKTQRLPFVIDRGLIQPLAKTVFASALTDWLILAFALGAGTFLRLWQIDAVGFNSDEAVYTGQAAAIVGDQALKPFFPMFRAHPFLFQFIVSFGFVFGVNDRVGRLYAVAFGLATIGLVYLLGSLLYGRRAGVLAALFLALMPYHVTVTRQMLLDGPLTFFTTLTLYLIARFASTQRVEWLYACGVGLGLTFLTKETGIIIIGAIYSFLALCPQFRIKIRDLALSVMCMILVIATFPISLALAGGGGAQKTQSYFVWQLFRRPNHDWTFYPTTVPFAIGILVIFFALLGLWFLRRERSWRETLLAAWIVVPVAFFQLWPTKGFQYLLPTAPAFVILASRLLSRWIAFSERGGKGRSRRYVVLAITSVCAVAFSLLIPSWQRIQPSTSGQFLAGSGGVPGGREAGLWIKDNLPENAQVLTVGPSMANIVQFYGHRKAYGLSVSSNPLHRNPSYVPVQNPDYVIRNGDLQYLVYDTFSASRSPFFADSLLKYVKRYGGRVVHTESVIVSTPDGEKATKPVIIIYEVYP